MPGQPIVERFVISPSNLPDPETLRAWVKSAQAGESEGQRLIYETFAGKMLLAIRRYIPGEQEALDVLQDGFLKVFHNIGGYTFRGSFEGWMRRIMVNMSIDALRSSKQLQFVGESEEMLDVLSAKELEQSEPECSSPDLFTPGLFPRLQLMLKALVPAVHCKLWRRGVKLGVLALEVAHEVAEGYEFD